MLSIFTYLKTYFEIIITFKKAFLIVIIMAIQVHLIERIYLYLSVKLNCKWMNSLLGFMFGKLKENFEAKLTD